MGLFRRKATPLADWPRCSECSELLPRGQVDCAMCGHRHEEDEDRRFVREPQEAAPPPR